MPLSSMEWKLRETMKWVQIRADQNGEVNELSLD